MSACVCVGRGGVRGRRTRGRLDIGTQVGSLGR